MEKIKIIDNQVILNFNKQFYSDDAIEMAIRDFSEICEVDETDKGLCLTPKEKTEINLIGLEFYNYVLGVMKNN